MTDAEESRRSWVQIPADPLDLQKKGSMSLADACFANGNFKLVSQ